MEILVLMLMLFCHIVDDYYLQGILASMKQKSWWKESALEGLYKYDYIVALMMHSFSWAFMIYLPITIWCLILGGTWCPQVIIANMIIHSIVDNEKANKRSINLIQDQLIHIIQIFVTWLGWLVYGGIA